MNTTRTVPHLKPTDIFTVSDDLPAEDLAALTDYLSAFASPKNADGKFACINCETEMDGMMAAFGIGAAYEWGFVHGEARCDRCGWPARGMHYIKRPDGVEVASIRNLFLPYHPSQVTKRIPAEVEP
jgi:hypothetical protein